MKKSAILFFVTIFCAAAKAQMPSGLPVADSVVSGKVVVNKDPRMEILAKKQAAHYSTSSSSNLGPRAAKGYRLMVLSSNDRVYAMNVRAQLLQRYPEQKVYMSYQAPFIKLKFGNFVDKGDADHYKRMIAGSKMVKNNIYVVAEIVEIKPVENEEDDKDKKDKK
jgi:hypothetical protein